MKAIILARVSTKEQQEGHSIAAQRLRLVDYCARKGLKVIKTYELVESSTRGERGCAETYKLPNPLRRIRVQRTSLSVALRDRTPPNPLRRIRPQQRAAHINTTEPLALAWFKDQQVKKQVAEMVSGMGLAEYTVEGEAIGRFSLPFEQIDRMLVSLKARRITSARVREISQAEFDAAEIDVRSGMELDAAERSAIGSSRVGSSDHTLPVAASISRTFQR
jgi:Resolvase, N terminal domain